MAGVGLFWAALALGTRLVVRAGASQPSPGGGEAGAAVGGLVFAAEV